MTLLEFHQVSGLGVSEMHIQSLRITLSQAEDICHCVDEARRIFWNRHRC